MPTYSYTYKKLHDIEWFFQCCGWPIHAVSNAGFIPSKIDRDKNAQVQYKTEELADVIESRNLLYINRDYVNYRIAVLENNRETAFEDYVRGFVRMAMKGFCSFDRDITQGWETKRYVLIAAPLEPTSIEVELTELVCYEDIIFYEDRVVYKDYKFVNWYFDKP